MNYKLIGLLVLLIIFTIISLSFAILTNIETKKIKDYYFKPVEYDIEALDLTLFDEFKFNNYDIIMKNCNYCLIFSFIVFALNIILLILILIKTGHFNLYSPLIFCFIISIIFHFIPLIIIFVHHYNNKNNIDIKSKDENFLYKFSSNFYYNDNSLKNYKKDHNFNFNYEINYKNCRLNEFYSYINWLLGANVLLLIILIIIFIIIYKNHQI
jgi:hypothetical protein